MLSIKGQKQLALNLLEWKIYKPAELSINMLAKLWQKLKSWI